jgi:hypothetical protein
MSQIKDAIQNFIVFFIVFATHNLPLLFFTNGGENEFPLVMSKIHEKLVIEW